MRRFLYALLFFWFAASAFAQDVRQAAITARSKQPAVLLNHEQAAAVLRDTVLLLGPNYGFLRKDGGNRCDVGAAFTVSCDWVIHIPSNQGCDLFGDAPGYGADGSPVRGTMQPAGCHLEPAPGPWVPVGPAPQPQPQPQPQPPAVDLGPILQRLAAVEAKLAVLDDLNNRVTHLRTDFDAAVAKPVELPLAVLLEQLQKVYFECSVGRSAFHGHACSISEPRAK